MARTGEHPQYAHAAQVRNRLSRAASLLEEATRDASRLRYHFTTEDYRELEQLTARADALYREFRKRASAI